MTNRKKLPQAIQYALLVGSASLIAGNAFAQDNQSTDTSSDTKSTTLDRIEVTGFDDGTGLGLRPLLLPDGFEGHPLRKDFYLAARVSKDWPGAKEPGQPHTGGPGRRKMQPPGVAPQDWGPR